MDNSGGLPALLDFWSEEMKTKDQWNDEFDAKYGIENLDDFIRDIQKDATQGGQVMESLKWCVATIEANLKTEDCLVFKHAKRIAYPPNDKLSHGGDTKQ
jgi:hypothetical protein